MRKGARFAALLLALMLPVCGARAFEVPGYADLSSAYERAALKLELTARLRVWKALSEASLPAVRDWLEDARLRLELSDQAERARFERQGKSLFALTLSEEDGIKRLTLENEGLAFETRGNVSPLSLLAGAGETGLDRLLRLPGPEALEDLPEELISPLRPFEEEVKRNKAIGQLGVSPRRKEYRPDAAAWQALWPKAAGWLEEILKALPAENAPDVKALRFEKGVKIRRFLDAEGEPFGWQMEGEALLPSGAVRKVNLLCGRVPGRGLYFSLKAPAARGKEDLSFTLSAALEKEELDARILLTSRLGEESRSLKGEARLRLLREGEADRLTGKLWLQDRRNAADEKLTLEPDLRYQNGRLEGTLALLREKGGRPWLDMTVEGALTAVEAAPMPEAMSVHDLDGSLEPARGAFSKALLETLRGMLMGFPQDAREVLAHDIGRTARTQGETLPAPPGGPDFIVMDANEGGIP